MAKARTNGTAQANPIGLDTVGATAGKQDLVLVRIGEGEFVHLWDGEMPIVIQGRVVGKGIHLCQSGKNAGVKGGSGVTTSPRIAHDARYVNCYRCARLASLNQARYGQLIRPRG